MVKTDNCGRTYRTRIFRRKTQGCRSEKTECTSCKAVPG